MSIRKNIIQQLDKIPSSQDEIQKMFKCFKNPDCEQWFKGVIESLYYRPNEFVLVCNCHPDESPFSLLYPSMYSTSKINTYDTLICELTFFKENLWLPKNQEFIIGDETPMPSSDKRLTSYCTSTRNWFFPQRNNFIHVEFNIFLFNKVDLQEFWIQCFNNYKIK